MVKDDTDGFLPPDFIEGIQKRIAVRKKTMAVTRKKGGRDIDWEKIKENVELLKKKCTDFSQLVETADSPREKLELAKIAREIKDMWEDIRAKMDGKGN
jgi:hypothetical protein